MYAYLLGSKSDILREKSCYTVALSLAKGEDENRRENEVFSTTPQHFLGRKKPHVNTAAILNWSSARLGWAVCQLE